MFQNKTFYYKIFNSLGAFLTIWSTEVSSDPSFKSVINGGLSELNINLARSFNSINENNSDRDINFRNTVELWISDKEQGSGIKIYSGFISDYSPYLDNNSEYIKVTCLGYVADLEASDFVDTNGNTAVQYSQQDPGFIIGDILTKVNCKIQAGSVNLTGQLIDYTYNNTTGRQAIDKAREYSLSDWYWYVGADNLLNFKQASTTTPNHTLTIGKDILKIDTQKTMRDLKNEVRFIGGFYDPTRLSTDPLYTPTTQLYKIYQDLTSIAQYGKRTHVIIDKRVISDATANAQANKFLAENAYPTIRATIDVIDSNGDDANGYDIESLHPGDTVKIIDPEYSSNDIGTQPYSLTQIFIIQTVQYDYDKATIELSQRPPWAPLTIQNQINKFIQDQNSSIPIYPSNQVGVANLYNVINNQVIGADNQPGIYVVYDSQHDKVAGFIGKDPKSSGIYGFISERGYGLNCRMNLPGNGADYGAIFVNDDVDSPQNTPSFVISLPGYYKTYPGDIGKIANKLKIADSSNPKKNPGNALLRIYGFTAQEVGATNIFDIGSTDLFTPFRLAKYDYSASAGPEFSAGTPYDQDGFMYIALNFSGANSAIRIFINGVWKTLIS